MKEVIIYFKAERSESFLFITTGVVSVLVSLWLWYSVKKTFYNGMATSLTAIAVVQLIVGLVIYSRTPSAVKRVEMYISKNPSGIKSEELPRMEIIMHRSVTYRYLEIMLAIVGLGLIFYFNEPQYWKGFGAGLFAQVFLMLVFDYFAQSRGKVYLDFLRRLEI